jgi:hypothetical protein
MVTDYVPEHFDTSMPHPLIQWISDVLDQAVTRAAGLTFCGPVWPTTDQILAQLAGHKALLAEHLVAHAGTKYQHCIRCADHEAHDALTGPCRTVRILGAIYSDRPGYQEVWRP